MIDDKLGEANAGGGKGVGCDVIKTGCNDSRDDVDGREARFVLNQYCEGGEKRSLKMLGRLRRSAE